MGLFLACQWGSPLREDLSTSGKVGSAVKIFGTNLTGATSVTFNSVWATFTVGRPSEVTTTVPGGATTGKVQVVTRAGTLSSNVVFWCNSSSHTLRTSLRCEAISLITWSEGNRLQKESPAVAAPEFPYTMGIETRSRTARIWWTHGQSRRGSRRSTRVARPGLCATETDTWTSRAGSSTTMVRR